MKLAGKGGREEKVFLQNEAIMSFRINKRIGFVLGLIGFDYVKKGSRRPNKATDRGG